MVFRTRRALLTGFSVTTPPCRNGTGEGVFASSGEPRPEGAATNRAGKARKAGQALVRDEPGQTGWKRGSGQGPRAEQASAAYIGGSSASCRPKKRGKKMRIERRYTKEGQSPYAGDRIPADHERNSQSRRLGRVPCRQRRGAGRLVAGRRRRHRAEIFPQGRRARAPEEGRGRDRPLLAVALGARRGGAQGAAREGALHRRALVQAGVRAARRHLDLLGLEGRHFDSESRRARLLRRARLHARDADGGAELAAMVQHRPALGLRHRRPEPGPPLRRLPDRQAGEVEVGLRASAAARLLHPVDRRRPRQRGRDHGPVGARGAPVQIRLRHRLAISPRCAAKASGSPAAASRPA